jgi:phosphoenolpyruvate carboxykinase (ATP)
VGKRFSIHHTRALLNAALDGKLAKVKYVKDPVFGFDVPTSCEGVPESILDPANTWPSRAEYFKKYDALAARFIENFKLFKADCPEHIADAGPKRVRQPEGAAV